MKQVHLDQDNSRVAVIPTPEGALLFRVRDNSEIWRYIDDNRYFYIDQERHGVLYSELEGDVPPGFERHRTPASAGTIPGNQTFFGIISPTQFLQYFKDEIRSIVRGRLKNAETRARERIALRGTLVFRGITWNGKENMVSNQRLSIKFQSPGLYRTMSKSYLDSTDADIEAYSYHLGHWVQEHLRSNETIWINGSKLDIEYRGRKRAKETTSVDGRVIAINESGVRTDDIPLLFRTFLCCQTEDDIMTVIRSTKDLPLATRKKLTGEHPMIVQVSYEIQRDYNIPDTRSEVPVKFGLCDDGKTIEVYTGDGKTFPVLNRPKFLSWCARDEPLHLEIAEDIFGNEMVKAVGGSVGELVKRWMASFEKSRETLLKVIKIKGGHIDKNNHIHVTGMSGLEYVIRVNPNAEKPPPELRGDGHLPVYNKERSICIVCAGRESMGYDRVTSTVMALAHDQQIVGQVTTLRPFIGDKKK